MVQFNERGVFNIVCNITNSASFVLNKKMQDLHLGNLLVFLGTLSV